MSSVNRFTFDGFAEFKAELRKLPADLTVEAGHIIEAATNGAEHDLKRVYSDHLVTGNLRDHVSSSIRTDGFAVTGLVRNTAKHAWIFENGTQARHYVSIHGHMHLTGAAKPQRVFIPIMIRARRRMYGELRDMLIRHGLEVSGDAAA